MKEALDEISKPKLSALNAAATATIQPNALSKLVNRLGDGATKEKIAMNQATSFENILNKAFPGNKRHKSIFGLAFYFCFKFKIINCFTNGF